MRKFFRSFQISERFHKFYGWLEDDLEEKMYKDGSFNTQDRLVDMFHAGMDKRVQERVMAGFMDRQLRVVCPTVAFGIGVSISDIDIVVLWGVSKTCLGLWQEIGRPARGQSRGMAIIPDRVYTGPLWQSCKWGPCCSMYQKRYFCPILLYVEKTSQPRSLSHRPIYCNTGPQHPLPAPYRETEPPPSYGPLG